MQENLLKNLTGNEIKSAEKYLIKYLQDLQKYFLLNNEELIKLLSSTIVLLKRNNQPKRWWKIF